MTPLRQRMLEDMRIRNLAPNTQQTYVQQVSIFARYFGRSPDRLGPEEVRAYQVHLVEERKLAPASLSIVAAALRFLYKFTLKQPWAPELIVIPKVPFKLPVVLSPGEVKHFLDSIHNIKQHAILTIAYAAGLRVSEVTHLKVTDIDSQRMVLRVDQGKGNKDRYVMLSPRLLEEPASFCRYGCSPGCFAACSCSICARPSSIRSCTFAMAWQRCKTQLHLPSTSHRWPKPSGWSTPNHLLGGHNRCLNTWGAIPTA